MDNQPDPSRGREGGDAMREGRRFGLPARGGLTPRRAGLIVLLVAAGLGIRWLLEPVLRGHAAYLTVYPMVAVAGVLWGMGPGALAGAVGQLSAHLLFVQPTPQLPLTPTAAVSFVVVVGSGLFLGYVGDRLRTSEKALKASADAAHAAQAALRDSEARYRTLFTAMDEGFQLCELVRDARGRATDYRFLDVNPGFERHSGLARERVVGRTAREVLPDLEQHWIDLFAHVAETGEPRRHEDFAGGVDRWYDVYAFSPAKGRFAAISVDVTERRRAEAALRASEAGLKELAQSLQRTNARLAASEATLSAILEALPVGVVVADAQGRVVRDNAATRELWGVPPETGSWEDYGEWVGWWPETGERIRADEWAMTRALRSGEVTRNQLVQYQRFGSDERRYLLHNVVPLRGEEGRIVGGVAAMMDATERLAAEEKLRASERKFRSVFEQAALGMARARLTDARWIDVNDAFLRMLGYDRDELLRIPWPEMTHPDDVDLDLVPFRRMAAGDLDSYTVEKRFVHRRGHHVWARLTLSLVRDARGRPEYGFAIVEDVGERKRAQQALREAHARLLESDRRKNQFLAMLSHELRNPLAPIRNSLYVLEHAAPGGQQAKRAHDVIGRQVMHMTRLVEELLDVTRISRGKVRLQRERVELCALVHRTAEDHRSIFAASGIALELRTCEGPLHASGDPTRLAQVIGNLLSNAAKFTGRGGRVELRLAAVDGAAEIRVRDDGAGIAPDLVDQLFEPFVQADATLDRSKGGLGLGLALVKGLVELHGGTVSARSEGPGTGAEFVLRLPLEPADAAPPEPGVAPPRRGAGGPARVLLIEDNADAADSLKEALELNGHTVEIARTGPEGVERARAFRPDVVLCDLGLPGLDGFEVARRLRADPELRAAPLIALSGYAAPEDLERSREAGFVHHLAKPPDLAALERTLAGLWDAGPGRRAGAPGAS